MNKQKMDCLERMELNYLERIEGLQCALRVARSDVNRLKQEVKSAWEEGFRSGDAELQSKSKCWLNSRAKQILEA
jgi:hypothetical protein